ncbi:MAG: glutamate-5-semialdehyde dehydrogenase [Candidatus Riflebacteria bacterium]|nr:glutamate-5-semialdehyde dehydrogenase [Candidatus Riflebacteria bacterium]
MNAEAQHPGEVESVARAARGAALSLALAPTDVKNRALLAVAARLKDRARSIVLANAEDCALARELVAQGRLARPLLDRLKLDATKLEEMAEAVRAVARLPDPCGRVEWRTLLDDGLELTKVTCPLGVVAVIFESRPDVLTQIGALTLKSGNAVILKGGSEAARTGGALMEAISAALAEVPGIPAAAIQTLSDREQVRALLACDGLIDLVIPRGSNELVRAIQSSTRIPVLGHAEGICHIYLDESARVETAVEVVCDAKLQYPAACNAVETVLVHATAAPAVLPPLLDRLTRASVQIRVCDRLAALFPDRGLSPATEADWRTEYCGPILSIRMVDSLDEAIDHINTYGSKHTDAIITEDRAAAERFMDSVDSAGVYHNVSTRFADGYRYGFGAEVGISTGKLHARGPVGLEGLVSYKYKLFGSGQVVATYSGKNARPFKHHRL